MGKGYYLSPIGVFEITADEQFLLEVRLNNALKDAFIENQEIKNELIKSAIFQLKEYFDGKRTAFNLPIKLSGTPFQLRVWEELMGIPYGEVRSYKDIACGISNPKAVRGIGQANRCNKFTIIVPCHRVIKSDGGLGGYFGSGEEGLKIKSVLLSLEKNVVTNSPLLLQE